MRSRRLSGQRINEGNMDEEEFFHCDVCCEIPCICNGINPLYYADDWLDEDEDCEEGIS